MNLVIIPAKYKSSRLPNKNFLPFYGGLSLLQIAVLRVERANIGKVVVSTDNDVLAASQLNAIGCGHVGVIRRPEELSKDPATVLDVLRHSIQSVNYEGRNAISVLPTSPINSALHIIKALELYHAKGADKLISITESSKPPYNAWVLDSFNLRPAFPDSQYQSVQSTRCPITYNSNGCIGIYDVKTLLMGNEFKCSVGYVMNMQSSWDIDHLFEFTSSQLVFDKFAEDLCLLKPYFRRNCE